MTTVARHGLQAGSLRVEVAPQLGGRVTRFWHHRDNIETDLFSAVDRAISDPLQSIAGGCFPLLPFSNRIAAGLLKVPEQAAYQLAINEPARGHAIHGHGRHHAWQVTDIAGDFIHLTYAHRAGDGGWIWPYRADMQLQLNAAGLSWSLAVENRHDHLPMPAGLGLHPYFPAPKGVRLTAPLTHIWRSDDSRIPHRPEALPEDFPNAGQAALPAGLDVGFGGWSGSAVITWPGDRPDMEIRADRMFSDLVIFTPPADDFFCVEPVSHAVNGFNAAACGLPDGGLRLLASGERLQGMICFQVAGD